MSDHHAPIAIGRYLLHRKIARGGMATIHIARLLGDVGFSRIVAAKRLHPELAGDREFVTMFLDEARIASKVHHRNVVSVLDVVTMNGEVVLVQEYVRGVPLSQLLRTCAETDAHVPVPVAAAIACQVLAGLHAAHETVDELGTPLRIVHRDVSPQNIMIATDGSARVLDFGIAKAANASHVTRKGIFKGKLGYSSPEQIRGQATSQTDIYALGVVLWEMLVGQRLHASTQNEAQLIGDILAGKVPTITEALAGQRARIGGYRWGQLEALEPIVRKALDINTRRRWTTAAEMEEAIAAAVPLAPAADISEWLRAAGREFLEEREHMIAEEEASWRRMLAEGVAPVPTHRASSPDLAIAGALPGLTGIGLPTASGRTRTATAPPGTTTAPAPPASAATSAGAAGTHITDVRIAGRRPALIAALVIALVVAAALLSRARDRSPPRTPANPRHTIERQPANHVMPVARTIEPGGEDEEAAGSGTTATPTSDRARASGDEPAHAPARRRSSR